MNRRLGIVIIFALFISALASLVVYRTIAAKLGLNPAASLPQIPVAVRDLTPGTVISGSDIRSVVWNASVPPSALRNAAEITGRGVIDTVYEGEPIFERRLAPQGAGGGLAATIPKGMRAVAVRIDEIGGVSGFAAPGMKVDVLMSGTPPSAGGGMQGKVSKIVLQNITVLSVGQNMQHEIGKPVTAQVVNLLVTPEQAEVLNLAGNETKIQLVLRNPLDKGDVATSGAAMAALFPDRSRMAPAAPARSLAQPSRLSPATAPAVPLTPAPARRSVVVEVLHGSDRSQARFNAPEERN